MKPVCRFLCLALCVLLLVVVEPVLAQEMTPQPEPLPPVYTLTGFTYEAQMWNNCGPATLTMGLTYFGYQSNQVRAAQWLKPDAEDKNVSPWQMIEFANTQIPEIPVYAMQRYGGTLETLKRLLFNQFPVIIEAGYDPPRANQGWMGHYLLIVGYDDVNEVITTYDSYDGQNMRYSYAHVETFWQHFNYTFIVLYTLDQQEEVVRVLGADGDEYNNLARALQIAQNEAETDRTDAYAWFNIGSSLVLIADYLDQPVYYAHAAQAFDQARNLGLPWRMTWYQFGIYEAYLAVGRYQDVIDMVAKTLEDPGGQYVEETYYYAGIAREMLGDTQRAINNYDKVLAFNRNFWPARERRDALLNAG